MSSLPKRLVRFLSSVNVAFFVRAARFGLDDASERLVQAYRAINPRQSRDNASDHEALTQAFNEIPTKPLEHLVAEMLPVQIDSRFALLDGAMPLNDLTALLVILRNERPEEIFEIGTFYGSTTYNMALNRPEATIHTIDLPLDVDLSQSGPLPKDDLHLIRGRQVGLAFRSAPDSHKIVQHFGDTATWDFSQLGHGITFYFIDGAHTYEYAQSDTIRCMEACGKPSVMLIHDCNMDHPGVVHWVRDMVRAGVPAVRIAGLPIAYFRYTPGQADLARLAALKAPRMPPGIG